MPSPLQLRQHVHVRRHTTTEDRYEDREADGHLGCGDDHDEQSRYLAFDESEFVTSLKAGRSYVSTGPALDVRIAGSVTEGIVHAVLRVGVQSAPWAEVSQLRVFVNGQIADERTIETPSVTDVELRIEADSFVTVEVEGEPSETYRAILPGYVPFAFTNPIYVDADANGSWTPPGL